MDKYQEQIRKEFDLIREWFRSGISETEILRRLEISASSLRRYRREHPEFDRVWQEGRAERDDQVETALFRRAVGTAGPEGGRDVLPDVRAAVFWLRNRRPRKWSDRRAGVPPVRITLLTEEKNL